MKLATRLLYKNCDTFGVKSTPHYKPVIEMPQLLILEPFSETTPSDSALMWLPKCVGILVQPVAIQLFVHVYALSKITN